MKCHSGDTRSSEIKLVTGSTWKKVLMKIIELTRHNKAEQGAALGCINNHKCCMISLTVKPQFISHFENVKEGSCDVRVYNCRVQSRYSAHAKWPGSWQRG